MKRIISLLICFVTLLSVLPAFSVSGASLEDGTKAIYKTFKSGEADLDYVYFSPVQSKKDKTKYPLILWLHGNSSGDYPGHQLENSDIYKFASDEFQERFVDAGGAFLLLPRDSTKDIALAWDLELDEAKSTLDAFVERYGKNIDTDRIYVGGNSMGGKAVYKIAAAYPDVFAAIFPVSPVYIPTNKELKSLANTSVWVFNNSNDKYPQLSDTAVSVYFSYLNRFSKNPENNRWSSFSTYYSTDGRADPTEIHNTWTPVCNDLFMDNNRQYKAITTIDGEGNKVKLKYPKGFIYWLSSQRLNEDATSSVIKGPLGKIVDLMISIINAIISLFGLQN